MKNLLNVTAVIEVGGGLVLLAASATWVLAQTDSVINACVLIDGTQHQTYFMFQQTPPGIDAETR